MPARFCRPRRHDLGLDVDEVQELGGVLADAAADHDQVGGEEPFDRPVVDGQPLGPLGVGQPLQVLDRARGPLLGVVAVDLEVAELGVGHQHAVVHDRRPDPGAERGDDDQPASAPRRAEPHLGQARRIGVVDHVDVAAGGLGEQGVGVRADPALVDVGGRAHDAVTHDRGDGDTDRPGGVGERREQLDEDLCHRFGRRGLRRLDAHAIGSEVSCLYVDRRALDARAAEVDAEGKVSAFAQSPARRQPKQPSPRHTGRVLDRGPVGRQHHEAPPRLGSQVPGRRPWALLAAGLALAGTVVAVTPASGAAAAPMCTQRQPVRRQGSPRGRRGQPFPHHPPDQRRRRRLLGRQRHQGGLPRLRGRARRQGRGQRRQWRGHPRPRRDRQDGHPLDRPRSGARRRLPGGGGDPGHPAGAEPQAHLATAPEGSGLHGVRLPPRLTSRCPPDLSPARLPPEGWADLPFKPAAPTVGLGRGGSGVRLRAFGGGARAGGRCVGTGDGGGRRPWREATVAQGARPARRASATSARSSTARPRPTWPPASSRRTPRPRSTTTAGACSTTSRRRRSTASSPTAARAPRVRRRRHRDVGDGRRRGRRR